MQFFMRLYKHKWSPDRINISRIIEKGGKFAEFPSNASFMLMPNGKICFMPNKDADLFDDGQIKKAYNKFTYVNCIETVDFTPLNIVPEFELEEPQVYDNGGYEIEEEDE